MYLCCWGFININFLSRLNLTVGLTTMTILFTTLLTLTAFQATQANTTSFIDPTSLSSKEPICQLKSIMEYKGDGGFKKSTAAGIAAAKVYDPDTISSKTPGRPNIFTDLLGGKTLDMDQVTTYSSALIAIAAFPIIIAIFNLCSCFCCVCCRNCCRWIAPNCCRVCKCIPKTTHYTKEEQYMPVLVYGVFAVMLFGFAIAGVSNGVHKFNDSLIEGICLTDNTYIRFSQFLTNVNTPLVQLETDFNGAVVALTDASKIDPQLSANVADIATKFGLLETAATTAKNNVPTTDVVNKPQCEGTWDAIANLAKDAKAESTTSAKTVDSSLTDLQKQLDSELLKNSVTATDLLVMAKSALADLQAMLDKSMDPRSFGLIENAHSIKSQKDNMGFSAFGWLFVCLMLITVAIFGVHECKHHVTLVTPPKDNRSLPLQVIQLNKVGVMFSKLGAIGWCCILFFGIFCGIFAALMLPLAAVMEDVCVVLPTLPSHLGKFSEGDMVTNIVDTCWNKTGNLLDGLSLSENIDVSGINFDSFDSQFATGVDIDSSGLDKILLELDKINEADCGPVSDVRTATNDVKTAIATAERGFDESTTVKKLKAEGKSLITLIEDAALQFVKVTNCYFVKVIWEDVSTVFCSSMKEAIQWWGSAELFIGLICLPFAITVLFMMKRYGGHGPIAAAGAEAFQSKKELEMTNVQDPYTVSNDAVMYPTHQDILDVTVPIGYGAGAFISVTNPNDQSELTVTVPEGVMEGMMFQIQLPAPATNTYEENQYVDSSFADATQEASYNEQATDYVVNVDDGGVVASTDYENNMEELSAEIVDDASVGSVAEI